MKEWYESSFKEEITTCCTRATTIGSSNPWRDYMDSDVPATQRNKTTGWTTKNEKREPTTCCCTTKMCDTAADDMMSRLKF